MADALIDHIHRVFAKAHGRDDRADVGLEKRTFREFAGPACGDVQHFNDGGHVLRQGERGGDRLCRVLQQRVGCVDVQIEGVGDICCHAAAGVPADICERVLQPGEVVQILQGGRAVDARVQIQRLHCRAAGPEVDRIAAHRDGAGAVAAMQDKGLGGLINRRLHQPSREKHPAIAIALRTSGQEIAQEPVRHFAQTQRFQEPECGVKNRGQVRLAERLVGSAGLTGRTGIKGGFRAALRDAFLASRTSCLSAQGRPPLCAWDDHRALR